MKCPHCGHEKSRVLETRGDRRVRQCGECLKDFSTIECLAAFAGRHRGWIHEEPPEDPLPVVIQEDSKQRQTKFQKFHPATIDDGLEQADSTLAGLLLTWWNESRWSKNKSKATWTRAAWLSNINRVIALPPAKAKALAERGVEQGWQSLQAEYVNDVASTPDGMLIPKDSAMQRALEAWSH